MLSKLVSEFRLRLCLYLCPTCDVFEHLGSRHSLGASPFHTASYRLAIMPDRHDKLTIISMAVVASAAATLLHEGVGHGRMAWLRGDVPTELHETILPHRCIRTVGSMPVGRLSISLSERSLFWPRE